MLNAREVHEQNILTADYRKLTPISFENLTILGEEYEEHKSEKHSSHLEETNLVQRQNSHSKEKQEARSVCCKISNLLRDKQSGTRGSYMFRKRRRRSERFAIVGYGTQPAAEETDHEDYSDDSVLLTSSDDEIAVYDHPGPNNFLEQDNTLTSLSKIIRRQLQNLATDTKQMKGKGAKMFAKRQERMEKFVIEGNSVQLEENAFEDESATENSNSMAQQNTGNENDIYNDPLQSARFTKDGASFFGASHNSVTSTKDLTIHQDQFKNTKGNAHVNVQRLNSRTEQERRYRPDEMTSWSSFGNIEQSASSEVHQVSLEPSDVSSCQSDNQHLEKMVFRSVKPPQPTLRIMLPVDANFQDKNRTQGLEQKSSHFSLSLQKPRKIWSSVKFDPTTKSTTSLTGMQEEQDKAAYPYSISPSHGHEKQKPRFTSATTTHNQPFKSVCTVPVVSKSSRNVVQPNRLDNPTSVRLLQKPLRTETNLTTDNKENAVNFKQKSVHGDRTPPSTSLNLPLERVKNDVYKPYSLSSNTKQTPNVPKHFNKLENTHNDSRTTTNEFEEDLKKPRVAACMKLLDPSKGKYEPKISIVYKPTPSVGEKSSSKNSCNKTTQFNKPIVADHGLPQATYFGLSAKSLPHDQQKQPQALGALAAGELKGKGARMFEKQQKRMDHFTKESNGSVFHGSVAPLRDPASKGPEEKTKEKMSQVVGEFKKVSTESESPNRPSATRTTKSKDPYHYHNYYVSGRAPSAEDFVNSDDFYEAASDSNLSTTSSMTSFDRYSRTSSNMLPGNENDDIHDVGGHHEGRLLKNPPFIAPKPKVNLSGELCSPSLHSGAGEDVFAPLPSPPAYKNATLQSSFNSSVPQ